MVRIEGHRIIRAPVQKVFQLVSHLDSQPRVTGLWLSADLVERKANTLTVHYRGYFGGMPVESTQRATLFPNQRIEFRQTRGGLKAFRGEYVLKPIEGDTELDLNVEAEVGIPLISEDSARLVLQAFVERSLQKFKLSAERDLPRVVRRPQEAVASAETPTEEPSAAEPVRPEPPPPPVQPVQARPPAAMRPQPPAPAGGPGSVAPGPAKRRRRRRRRRRRGGGTRPQQGMPNPPQSNA